jgi:hypothetical protein
MAERVVIGYKRLFEVRLLHHYWLDEGSTVFDLITDQSVKDKRLLTYDVRKFLSVAPTKATETALKGFGCIFKATALGFVVAVPAITPVPMNQINLADATFEFVVKVQNADFFNYTALTLQKQQISEWYHQPEDKIYRYKENVAVFSNINSASRTFGGKKILFLSQEIQSLVAADKVESLFKTGNILKQLISDLHSETQDLVANADDFPAFANQRDAPDIVPPSGLSGTPLRGIELTNDLPNDIFALIRIQSLPAVSEFKLLKELDAPNPLHLMDFQEPVFEIRFRNRSTIRKYYNKATKVPGVIEPHPLPLTFYGNAGTKQKPSEGFVKYRKTKDPNEPGFSTAPLRLVSEIFE